MPTSPEPDVGHFRPLNGRRRLLILLLAVATAVTVVLTLLDPPGGVQRPRAAPAASMPAATPAPCADGQSSHCIGGKVEVIVPAPAAPAGR